jgi:TolB-like protein
VSLFEELKRRNVLRVTVAYIVIAWLTLQVGDTLAPALRLPEWTNSALAFFLILGFPLAIFLAWAYELTPEGLRKEKDVDRANSITHITGRKLDFLIIAVLSVALTYFAFDKFALGPSPEAVVGQPAADKSIVVLPFADLSPEGDQGYFSDGIAEELLNLLAGIPELRVISRSSAFSFKGKNVDIPTIAQQLNVAHVLEGSVRKDGQKIRITAQLIDARTDTHLWSATYDRTLDDIFVIQDEIAGQVTESLKATLLGGTSPKSTETDPEAYALYLRGAHLKFFGTEEASKKAETYLREALAIDPEFAPAWGYLFSVLVNSARSGFIDYDEGHRQARAANSRHLELNPNSAEAHTDRAWLAMMYDRNLEEAAEHIKQARALAPNDASVLATSSTFAETMGRIGLAIELGERGLLADPLNSTYTANLATVYAYSGQLDRAEELLNRAIELRPDNEGSLVWLAKIHLLQGRAGDAIAVAERISTKHLRLWSLPMAYHDLGQQEKSNELLRTLIDDHADIAASFIAENHAWRGEIDQAFTWLDRAINENQFMWGSLVFDPAFRNLHDDPRWNNIRTRVGRSEEQLKKIEF